MNESDSRTQSSPIEIYEAKQSKQRTQTIVHVKELWISFVIRHALALVLLLIGGLPIVGVAAVIDQLVMMVVFACGAGICFLSWITAIRLGIYIGKNNRMQRLWLIYLSWLPAAIIAAEALFVLEAFVSS